MKELVDICVELMCVYRYMHITSIHVQKNLNIGNYIRNYISKEIIVFMLGPLCEITNIQDDRY